MVSKNFSNVSLFPAKGVIFPPFISVALLSLLSFILVGFLVTTVVVSGSLHSRSASKNRSIGALNSGVVWKLSSVSVCSLVVWGSGVGVLLHRCSRLNGLKGAVSCTLGLPTRLRNNGSSSESSSFRSRNSPCLCAIVAFLVLHPRMEQGFVQRNLCYDLINLQR